MNITDDFIKLASMMANISYEIGTSDLFDEEKREMFMDVWRRFDYFNELSKEID